MVERVGKDLRLDLLSDAVRMWPSRATALLDKRGDAADLKRPADFVEGVAVVAHDAAGFSDVLQFLGKMQQRELPSSTLGQGGHSQPPE